MPEFSKCIVISSSVAIQRSREREFIKGKDTNFGHSDWVWVDAEKVM